MSDESEVPQDLPAPEAPPPPPDTSEETAERRHTVLGQLAKDENIEEYTKERADQEAFFDRGEDLPESRKSEWYRRAHKSLSDAANEAAGVTAEMESQQQEPAPEYAPEDAIQDTPEYREGVGAARVRFEQHFGGDAERKQTVMEWHQALDPEHSIANWYIQSGSPVAPEMADLLANNPTQLEQIAQLPPRQRDAALSKLEGYVTARKQFIAQQADWQAQAARERASSKAPPIIRAPKGQAMPPSDPFRLAAKEDITDYVRARKGQERKA